MHGLMLVVIMAACTNDNNEAGNSPKDTKSDGISKEKAEEVALEDVESFKKDNSDFSINSIERKDMKYRDSGEELDSWVIIIESKEANEDEASPNILYQIDAQDGSIIDKTDHAMAE